MLVQINRVEPVYRDEVHSVLNDFDEQQCAELIAHMEQMRVRLQEMLSKNTK